MKLSELHKMIATQLKFYPREDPDVVVRTMNPSVGPVSVAQVYVGSDWNKGNFFFRTVEDVCKAVKMTTKEIVEQAKEYATLTHERLGFEYARKRRDAWIDGFVEGARYGSTKLIEKNADPEEPICPGPSGLL